MFFMTASQSVIDSVRQFNRFYTRSIGVLGAGHLGSPFSLTEVRVLYEISHRDRPTASSIAGDLALDPGYLSRILRKFEQRRMVARKRSAEDARQSYLSLTPSGKKTFSALDRRAHDEIASLLKPLSPSQQSHLVRSMREVEAALSPHSDDPSPAFTLRQHRPGDMGWVVHRHGVLYNQEYGWDERFEALVAQITADFIRNFDRERERCWIAERESEIVGSVFLVKKSAKVAKLRLLLVEPAARGLGIGRRLVFECIDFAREAGYRKLTLWTNDVLHAARHIYQEAGFRLVSEQPHEEFGSGLIAQVWDLDL